MKRYPLITRIFRFSISGCFGMAVDYSFTILFKEYFSLNPYFSNFLGIIAAIIVLFILHKKWTFADANQNVGKQFQQFIVISLIGCIWNSGLVYLFHQYFSLPFYIGKFFAIILVSSWNFLANSSLTFKIGPKFSRII